MLVVFKSVCCTDQSMGLTNFCSQVVFCTNPYFSFENILFNEMRERMSRHLLHQRLHHIKIISIVLSSTPFNSATKSVLIL